MDTASAAPLTAAVSPSPHSSCFRGCCVSQHIALDVPKSEFTVDAELFSGPSSTVFLGRFRGAPVAVKRPRLPTKADIDRYHTELRLMASFDHAHILRLDAARAFPPEYFLLFPYMANGSVASLLHERGWTPSWGAVLVLATQVSAALEYLHDIHAVVHRDVKPSNILMNDAWCAQIADFGLAEKEATLRASLQAVRRDTRVCAATKNRVSHLLAHIMRAPASCT